MEYLISNYDLIDVVLKVCKYTWINRRAGGAYVVTRLDMFFIYNGWLLKGIDCTSAVISNGTSNHHPIILRLDSHVNYVLIHFCLNVAWVEEGVKDLIIKVWKTSVQGSPYFLWESKVYIVKKSLRKSLKETYRPLGKKVRSY